MSAPAVAGEDAVLPRLLSARSKLDSIVSAASAANESLMGMDGRLSRRRASAASAAVELAPLQSQAISAKALESRINRAVPPALAVLRGFSMVEALQSRLASMEEGRQLAEYVETVDRLHAVVGEVTAGCEAAVQRLQEAVEFVSRTKAAERGRTRRMREAVGALRALWEGEVEAMRYDGLLDRALVRLQDEFHGILQNMRHPLTGDEDWDSQIQLLARIAQTLAGNDCLDICIDIFVKVRYRRAAKALLRLNPDYLKLYAPEEIDAMEWEALETAITLWMEHFELAVRTVFVAEKRLCGGVLADIMDGAVWPECFVKIADKIMAVFFRFGEGVARSSKEPQKLFKLLDMFDAMDRICDHFVDTFDGDAGEDICTRFRELQKLLVHGASKVFWEFGLQIEGLQDGAPPPPDGSVHKVVRYAVNYLKCLAASGYAGAMGRVLRTEQVWKAGFLSKPEPDESLLRDAVLSLLDALQRNVEAKRAQYKDKVVGHVFTMNSYWYMYMRTRGSELAALVGEETMRRRYKVAAEEAAYAYQAQAWGTLVEVLEREDEEPEAGAAVARGKMEAFMRGFDENLRRHRSGNICIPDGDLREQIGEAVTKLVAPVYNDFLRVYLPVMQGRPFLPSDSIPELLAKLFDGGDGAEGGQRPVEVGRMSVERSTEGGRRVFRNQVVSKGRVFRTANFAADPNN